MHVYLICTYICIRICICVMYACANIFICLVSQHAKVCVCIYMCITHDIMIIRKGYVYRLAIVVAIIGVKFSLSYHINA